MKIWRFKDPSDYTFACAGLRGTWDAVNRTDPCPECTSSHQTRVKPLVIEWETGSDIVGDFMWPGLGNIAVREEVIRALMSEFNGVEPGPVEMVQDSKLRKPKRITKRTKPRIWLPYLGPPLCDLWVNYWVHMDYERTTAELIKTCETCGRHIYDIVGLEREDMSWDNNRLALIKTHIPRSSGQGLYVPMKDLSGNDIFKVNEFDAWILCTDRVRNFINENAFTNVTFFEVGELF